MCKCLADGCDAVATHAYQLSVHLRGAHGGSIDRILPRYDPGMRQRLERYLRDSGPGADAADEAILAAGETGGGWDIAGWLSGGTPRCREERQYAHLLAARLAASGPPVEQVLFEVTLMRDLFAANGADVTDALYEYCGQAELRGRGRHPNHEAHARPLARWMMNAKPDLGLLLRANAEYRLYFVECKLHSPEALYRHPAEESLSQTGVQERILDFLCRPGRLMYRGGPVRPGRVMLLSLCDDDEPGRAPAPPVQNERSLVSVLLNSEARSCCYPLSMLYAA